MKDRQSLIDSIFGLEEKFFSLMLAYKADSWMALDLSIDQLKSLIYLEIKGRTSFTELAQALNITRSNITGIADRLVQSGLITRYQNPEDRRVQFLLLTQKGKDIITNLKQRNMGEITKIMDGLSMDELVSLEKGLHAFFRSAKAHLPSLDTKSKESVSEPVLNQ